MSGSPSPRLIAATSSGILSFSSPGLASQSRKRSADRNGRPIRATVVINALKVEPAPGRARYADGRAAARLSLAGPLGLLHLLEGRREQFACRSPALVDRHHARVGGRADRGELAVQRGIGDGRDIQFAHQPQQPVGGPPALPSQLLK